MPASPSDVLTTWLQNGADPAIVHDVVAENATYVSLNTENAELARILPWAGTSHGPQAFLDNIVTMFQQWEAQSFDVTTIFESGDKVAAFGEFRLRSTTTDKIVTSPWSILATVENGKITFLQFQEDSFATANGFRTAGKWTVQTQSDGASFEV